MISFAERAACRLWLHSQPELAELAQLEAAAVGAEPGSVEEPEHIS